MKRAGWPTELFNMKITKYLPPSKSLTFRMSAHRQRRRGRRRRMNEERARAKQDAVLKNSPTVVLLECYGGRCRLSSTLPHPPPPSWKPDRHICHATPRWTTLQLNLIRSPDDNDLSLRDIGTRPLEKWLFTMPILPAFNRFICDVMAPFAAYFHYILKITTRIIIMINGARNDCSIRVVLER